MVSQTCELSATCLVNGTAAGLGGGQEEAQVKEEPVDSSSEEPTLQCKSEEGETEPDGTAIQIHRTVPVNAMPLAEYCWYTLLEYMFASLHCAHGEEFDRDPTHPKWGDCIEWQRSISLWQQCLTAHRENANRCEQRAKGGWRLAMRRPFCLSSGHLVLLQ